jgi:hypothetical protein
MSMMTVTNQKAYTLNDLDVYQGDPTTPTVNATGGARKRPLPYPFEHVVLGPNGGGSDAKTLPVCPRDFRKAPIHEHVPLQHGEEWNQLVQGGIVTVVFGAQAGVRDVEHVLIV